MELGITYQQIANRVGVSRSTVVRAMVGEGSIRNICKIGLTLGMKLVITLE